MPRTSISYGVNGADKKDAANEPLTREELGSPELTLRLSRLPRRSRLSRLLGHRDLLQPDTARKLVAELWGTFLLVFVGVGSIVVMDVPNWEHGGSLQIALAFGFAVAVGVYSVAHISGGHLNPAVSFALLVTGELPLVRCVLYVAAQLAGSSLACGALRIALPEHYFAQVNVNGSNFNFGVTMPSSSSDFEMSVGGAILVEAIITAVLVLTVCSSSDANHPTYGLAPLMVGLSVVCCHYFAIQVTGSSMNPARSFGPALFSGNWTKHYVYWVGPMAGGAVAALLYKWALALTWDCSRCSQKRLVSRAEDECGAVLTAVSSISDSSGSGSHSVASEPQLKNGSV